MGIKNCVTSNDGNRGWDRVQAFYVLVFLIIIYENFLHRCLNSRIGELRCTWR